MKRAIDFYYFTGTGNTLLVVKQMKKIFEENRYKTDLHRIEKTDPQTINPQRTVGLAVPVAFQTTYPFIWNFINNLPEVDSTEIFLVDTMGGFSGGLIGPVKKTLAKKGYIPIGAKEIKMPSNFNKKQLSETKKEKIISKGLHKAKLFAHDLVFGLAKWPRIPFISDGLKKLGTSEFLMNKLRNKYPVQLNEYKCIRCGLCFRLCPVDNIEMKDYPEFLDKCEFCQRCLNFCPTNAIIFHGKELAKYSSMEVEEILGEKA